MRVGVVKEIKDKENRIALTPSGASQLVAEGHQVSLEEDGGIGCGFSNDEYLSAGAEIVSTAAAWDNDLVVKIKEPLEQEYQYLKENLLFTYFHLAGVPATLTDALIKAGTSAIAYETVEDDQERLPLLAPMSAVAGNVAAVLRCVAVIFFLVVVFFFTAVFFLTVVFFLTFVVFLPAFCFALATVISPFYYFYV